MQVSKKTLKLRFLIIYHKNSTYRIFKDQNNEKHERKIISPLLLYIFPFYYPRKQARLFVWRKYNNMIINTFNK